MQGFPLFPGHLSARLCPRPLLRSLARPLAAFTWAVTLLVLVLPCTGYAQAASSPSPSGNVQRVIFDTDIGDDIDDVFALGIVLNSPELKLAGITSAWGDTALRSRMIDRLLCETGRQDIPVYTGVPTHRSDAAAFSQAQWARAGKAQESTSGLDAVGFILREASSHPGEVTLIAVAPLTNIGAAIDRDPAAFRKLKRVVLMGGSVKRGYDEDKQPGIATKPSAEYNIAMDPAAAQKLFRSGVPIFMMPLDATQITFDATRSAEFAKISTPLTDAIQVLTAEWTLVTQRTAPTLFDSVAVAFAIEAKSCPTTPVHIDVDEKGFTHSIGGAPNAEACLVPHAEAFFALAMPRLLEQKLVGHEACLAR